MGALSYPIDEAGKVMYSEAIPWFLFVKVEI